MKVIIFGATGMVGQGVLRECLLDAEIKRVITIGRSPTGKSDEKIRECLSADLANLSGFEDELRDADACFFCLGVSSVGLAEAAYRQVTYDLTLAVAGKLAQLSPRLTFIYVSGAGTDSSEQGRSMWARVKGVTENALLRVPFKTVCMFRPAFIQPLHGVTSKTRLYRTIYALSAPITPMLTRFFPGYVTTTERVARAMIKIAKHGTPKPVLESRDINAL